MANVKLMSIVESGESVLTGEMDCTDVSLEDRKRSKVLYSTFGCSESGLR